MNTNSNIEKENNRQHHTRNRIAAGIIIIGIGIVLFADKMGVDLPQWLLSWHMLLVVAGLYVGFKDGFRNLVWLILTGTGVFLLWDEVVMDLSLKPFAIPILLVAAGLFIILRPAGIGRNWHGYRPRRWERRWERRSQDFSAFPDNKTGADSSLFSDDFIDINCVMSGVQQTVISKTFKGGRISCVLGGTEIDLTKADIQETAVLQIHEILGGITLIIPPGWAVRNNIHGVLHGVEDERRGIVQEDTSKVLVLQGSAILAGIEIKSY